MCLFGRQCWWEVHWEVGVIWFGDVYEVIAMWFGDVYEIIVRFSVRLDER